MDHRTRAGASRSAHARVRRSASPPSGRCGSPSKGSAGWPPSTGLRHRRSVSCGRPHQRAAAGLPGRRRHRTGGVADAAPMSSARGCRSPFRPSSASPAPALARPEPQVRRGGRGLSAPGDLHRQFSVWRFGYRRSGKWATGILRVISMRWMKIAAQPILGTIDKAYCATFCHRSFLSR